MTLFEKALVAHLVGDWLLQNDWMARYKADLRHPAAWCHSAIHALLLAIVLGWRAGVILGLVHLIVDTRRPQQLWSRLIGQTQSGEFASHVLIWGDQVLHIAVIALWLVLAPRIGW